LESLGLVKRIAFDKTGTLTQGQFALLHLEVVGSRRSRKEVLEMLSLMEERASHPLSQAILVAARNEGVSIPMNTTVLNHTFIAGEGVKGTVNGCEVYVGNERLFKRLGLFNDLPASTKDTCNLWASTGGTVGFMSIEGDGIVCTYSVTDAVRPEAKEVVDMLHRMGISVSMLTGDNTDTALAIGEQIGLSESQIRSRLLPEEKLSIVNSLKEAKNARSVVSNPLSKPCLVLMCGDGVNDAPALAAADVSVAMGAGAALAMDTSDVTLLDSDLRKLVYSIRMGRRVIRKIKENIVFSVTIKLIVVGFALAGKTRLWAAILSDVGAMILVTLNGMSLLPSQQDAKRGISAARTHDGDDDALDVEAANLEVHGGSRPLIRSMKVASGGAKGCCDHHDHGCCGGPSTDCHNEKAACGSGGCCEGDDVHNCCGSRVEKNDHDGHSDCASGCQPDLETNCEKKPACHGFHGAESLSCSSRGGLISNDHSHEHEHHNHEHHGHGHHDSELAGHEHRGLDHHSLGHLGDELDVSHEHYESEHHNHEHHGNHSHEHHGTEDHNHAHHSSEHHHGNEHRNHEHNDSEHLIEHACDHQHEHKDSCGHHGIDHM
jgi:soluble P-type ATPase